jgi:flavin reductase (DIM6/NTAB) family NADH-FMN oxidoreductase RutF
VLEDVVAWIDCELWAEYDGGDHTLVAARVLTWGADPDGGRCCSTAAPTAAGVPQRLTQQNRTAISATSSRPSREPATAASHSCAGPGAGRVAARRSTSSAMPSSRSVPGRSMSPSV